MNRDIKKIETVTVNAPSIRSGFINLSLVIPLILFNIFNELVNKIG